MRFAVVGNDPRLVDLVRLLDREGVPVAQTWRAVGEGAERLGLWRPGYGLLRKLVRLERRRRQLRAATVKALKTAASGLAAGRAPFRTLLDDLEQIGWRRGLVLNEHKPP